MLTFIYYIMLMSLLIIVLALASIAHTAVTIWRGNRALARKGAKLQSFNAHYNLNGEPKYTGTFGPNTLDAHLEPYRQMGLLKED